jgi:hypothetical protein
MLKYIKFIKENKLINGIEVIYIGNKRTETLKEHFTNIYMYDDDFDTLVKYSPKINVFELKIPFNLELGLYDILEKGDLTANILYNKNYTNQIPNRIYWIDMGNGLTSIAEETFPNYNNECYYIYSGEKRLDKFLKEDLEILLNAEKYNL